MLTLVAELKNLGIEYIIIVDDGSSPDARVFFDTCEKEYGCHIERHESNKGKGEALKTIASHVAAKFGTEAGYVTADCDLQHSPNDILRVAECLNGSPGSLVLGCRDFSSKGVPLRSSFGNKLTSYVYWAITGLKVSDTQTGLRGIPGSYAARASIISGSRFEYEMNVLMDAAAQKLNFAEVPIATIYLEQNKASAYRSIVDSARIYKNIWGNAYPKIISSIADLALYAILAANLSPLSMPSAFMCYLAARALAAAQCYLLAAAARKDYSFALASLWRAIPVGIACSAAAAFGINPVLAKLACGVALNYLLYRLA
jgi:glycosyltransferase involved in cell wall biosynthesis